VIRNSEENPGDISLFKPFKALQFDAIFVYSKQQENQGDGLLFFSSFLGSDGTWNSGSKAPSMESA